MSSSAISITSLNCSICHRGAPHEWLGGSNSRYTRKRDAHRRYDSYSYGVQRQKLQAEEQLFSMQKSLQVEIRQLGRLSVTRGLAALARPNNYPLPFKELVPKLYLCPFNLVTTSTHTYQMCKAYDLYTYYIYIFLGR